ETAMARRCAVPPMRRAGRLCSPTSRDVFASASASTGNRLALPAIDVAGSPKPAIKNPTAPSAPALLPRAGCKSISIRLRPAQVLGSDAAMPRAVERVHDKPDRHPGRETYPCVERQPEHQEQRRGCTEGRHRVDTRRAER